MAKPKKINRAQARALQYESCAKTKVNNTYDICIAGGGAAGLSAAITAAETGVSVLVLEQEAECGKKILATGNGRCNFTNENLDPKFYSNPKLIASIFKDNPLKEIQDFFSKSYLMWTQEGSLFYPRSLQSSSVRDLLVLRAKKAGVTLACGREITKITGSDNNFNVVYKEMFGRHNTSRIKARKVIVTTGGGLASMLSGYNLTTTPFSPCLCAIATKRTPSESVDGRRISCKVTLTRNNKEITSQTGEVMFRKYGLSGIAIFNLSRYAQPKDKLIVDMFYDTDKAYLLDYLTNNKDTKSLLYGMVDPKVADEILRQTNSNVNKVFNMLTHLTYEVKELANTKAAQVTKGGISTNEVDFNTLEVRSVPGLYLAGEVLDVDADCGGFNLSWAWLSGIRTSMAATTSLRG